MLISALLFFLVYLLFSLAIKPTSISLLIASFFLCLTPVGETNFEIVIILVSLIFCLYRKTFLINKKRFLILLLIISINIPPILVSFDYDLYKALGKSLKIFVFLLPFTFSSIRLVKINFDLLIKSMLFLSFLFSFLWLFERVYDGGYLFDIRLSGIVLDPNYSVTIICALFILLYLYRSDVSINRTYIFLLFLFLFLSQSVSSIILFIALFLLLKKTIIFRKNGFLFFILTLLVILNILCVMYFSHKIHLTMLSDWNDSYISLKINSLLVRLYSQIEGIRLMIDKPYHFIYGFGSRTTFELFGKVMHNAYLQTLFDHGLSLLVSIYLFINIIGKKYFFYPAIFYLQIMNFLFDNYFMGLVTLFYILGLLFTRYSLVLKENT
uniref:O-antigen polymerase n=1 Tax=Providencia alcalifaciens TaxID=126385 RepID=M9P0Y1_9GAMM|nr:O-antigen polymerase [Providencia alcalifaciens]